MTEATKFQWAELWVKFITSVLSNKILTTALLGMLASASTNVIQYFDHEQTAVKLKNTQASAEYLTEIIMKPEPITVQDKKKTIIINNCPDCMKAIKELETRYHK